MKPARPLLLLVGVIAVLLLLVAGIARLPSFQRWVVLRAVESEPGLRLSLERVSAGPFRFEADNVALQRGTLDVRIGHVEGSYSLWQFLAKRRVSIRQLAADNVVIDATKTATGGTAAGAVAAPAAAPGVLAHAELPYEIVLGEVAIKGRALLPSSPGRAPLPAEFSIAGGGLAPGAEGELRLQATVTDTTPNAAVSQLRVHLGVQLLQTHARRFDRAAVTLVVDAEGAQFADQNQLRVTAEMSRTPAGERYSANIDTLLGSDTDHLLTVRGALNGAGQEIAGDWSLQVRDAQIQPFFLGGTLPKFAADGAGTFTVRPATGGVTLAGRLQANASELEAATPALRAVGPVKLESEFDFARDAAIVRVNRLRARLDGADKPVLSLEAARSAAVNLATWKFDVNGGSSTAELARLKLTGLPLAWVRPFVSAVDVSGGVIEGEFTVSAGENQLRLDPILPVRITELTVVKDGKPLVERAQISASIAAAWLSDVIRARVSELDVATAGGDRLAGRFAVEVPLAPGAPLAAEGELTATKLKPTGSFSSLGEIRLAVSGDITKSDGRLEVRAFKADIRQAAQNRQLLSAQTSTFAVDLASFRVSGSSSGDGEIGQVSLGAWPLAILAGMGGGLPVGGEFSGGTVRLASNGGLLQVRTVDPLRFAGMTVQDDGELVFDRVDFAVSPEADITSPLEWKMSLKPVELRTGGARPFATVGGEVSANVTDGVRGRVNFDIDLPAASSQPLLSGARALNAGRASGEIRIAATLVSLQAEARATINGLVAKDASVKLPVANLSLRAERQRDGRITIEAPLLLDRLGQRSELRLTANAIPRGDLKVFDGKLTGKQVELQDALGLLGLFGAPVETMGAPAGTAPADRAPVVADTDPFWKGLQGELELDIKSMTNGPDWTVGDINGALHVAADRVTLREVTANINKQSRFTADGELAFAKSAQPYRLKAGFSLADFDLGAFLKSFDPERPPVIEGIFNIAGRFGGDGATLGDTLDKSRGQFHLTGGKGIFRGLKRASEKVSVASKAVEIGAALGSIFGTSKVKEAAERVAGQSYQVDQLAQALGEFPFDQLILRTTRDESLDVKIEELSLISPEVRLVGTGVVTYEAGTPILDQRLNLTYAISSRGKIEKLLEKLKVLDGAKDELGYATTKEKGVIVGTLAKPDASSYFLKLAESKFTDFLSPQ